MAWYGSRILKGCLVSFLILIGGALISRTSPTNRVASVVSSAVPINPIVRENQKPGTQRWKSSNFDQYFNNMLEAERLEHATQNQPRSAADSGSGGDPTGPGMIWTDTREIKGYASLTSVSVGGTITFHISSTAANYTFAIYRQGWYGGDGATEALAPMILAGTNQPNPTPDPTTGMIDANWPVSYTLNVPSDWTSGVYLVWLQNVDSEYESYIPFVVRNDNQTADILYVLATSTWQAYNNWGGKSLYEYNSDGGRALKVSYNRPYEQNDGSGHFYSGDYNMLRWLELNGYDVTYATSEDLHSNPNLMNNRKVLLSDFHDEYYSMEMYDHVLGFRDAGKSLAYFTSNNIYWQIRYENDGNGHPLRTIVCYKKETEDPYSSLDPWLNDPDPNKQMRTTVLFRDAPVNRPENQVLGVMFESLVGYGETFPWTVQNADHWIYDGTGLEDGDTIDTLVGYEWDRTYDNGLSPENMTIIGQTEISNSDGDFMHQAVIWQAPSGAWVLSVGVNYWQYLLDGNYIWPLDERVQRMTSNVLNHMITDAGDIPTLTPTYTPTDGPSPTPSNTPEPSPTFTPSLTATASLTKTATNIPGPTTNLFYRAINVGGPALVIDGNTWEANEDTTPNFTMVGDILCNPWQPVTPPTDANRTTMIQCSRQHWAHNAVMSSMPNGTYDVYVYTWLDWEDPDPPNYNFYLQGQLTDNYQSGPIGKWSRLGPWTASVTDGTLTLQTDGGLANISGIEVYEVVDAEIATSTLTSTATATNTDLPAATATSTATATETDLPAATATSTATATNTDLPAATATFTATATNTDLPAATTTSTATATETDLPAPTATSTATATNTDLPVPTATSTATATNTDLPAPTATSTATATDTDLPAATATFTATATNTDLPAATATSTATATNTDLPAATATSTATATNTDLPTATATSTATATNTDLPTVTATSTATATFTATATNTDLPTVTATSTATSTFTATATYTASATQTATATSTFTATATATPTSTPTPNRRDTIGIFRQSVTTFFFRNSNSTGFADSSITFGLPTDYPIVGDWNGDGIDTAGVYRRSTGEFFLTNSLTNPAVLAYSFTLGIPNDQPIVGDWDGDGKDGVGVYRPSNGLIYLKNNLTTGFADFEMVLGIPGDVGIAGDWDGDGKDSPGVYRPSNQVFYLTNQVCFCSVFADYTISFGTAADTPFVGDWDGDGRTGIGVYRRSNGTTYLKNGLISGFADLSFVFGSANDQPLAGVWTLTAPPSNGGKTAPTFQP